MLGSISLKNPSEFSLDREAYTNDRFRTSHKRAFRPDFAENHGSLAFILGTALFRSKPFSAQQFINQAESAKLEDIELALDGLYVIVHYDKSRSELSIINNNYQLTKIYYVVENDTLYFSHQLELLLPKISEINPYFPSILNFLRNGFNQSELTQIAGIKKLLPSQAIRVSQQGMSLSNRWSQHYRVERKPIIDLEAKLDEYEATYQNALSNYLEARSPDSLGTLLSGGHDTSFVLIQSSKVCRKPVHCFTTVFSNWSFSEKSYAESTCKKFSGEFHPKEFTAQDLDLLGDLIKSCEEPVLGSSLPLHALAQYASNYTDTLLGGDGGDTLWGEYHPVGEYHRWVKNWPLPLRILVHRLSRFLRNTTDWERFWELEHVCQLFCKNDYYQNFLGDLCTYRHFGNSFLADLLSPDVFDSAPAKSCMQVEFTKDNFDEALIEGKLLNGFFTYQSFQQTRSMNAFGMEFYLPTVQTDVMNFINSLPMNWINGGTTFHRLVNSKTTNRKFHKHALARYLKKEEIYNRSFDIPWHLVWEERPETLSLGLNALKKRGWYRDNTLDHIFNSFKKQRNKDFELLELKSHGYRIMALLSLEIWARIYLDQKGQTSVDSKTSLNELLS